jgi:hypothetical protein
MVWFLVHAPTAALAAIGSMEGLCATGVPEAENTRERGKLVGMSQAGAGGREKMRRPSLG